MEDELIETEGVLFDECLVVEFLVDDDVHHGQGKRPIRTRSYPEVHLCLVCQRDVLGINHHQPGPLGQVFLHGHPQGEIRGIRVVAPEDVQVGILFFHGVLAESDLASADAHAVADTLDRKEIGGSKGGLEPLGQACHLQVFHPDGATENTQYLGSEFFPEPVQLLCYLIQGLVPGDRLKTAVHPFQGLLDAVGAVNVFKGVFSLGAELPLVEGMGFQTLDLYGPPVFHRDPATAAVIAERTVRQYLFSFSHNYISFLGLGLCQWRLPMISRHRVFCPVRRPNDPCSCFLHLTVNDN